MEPPRSRPSPPAQIQVPKQHHSKRSAGLRDRLFNDLRCSPSPPLESSRCLVGQREVKSAGVDVTIYTDRELDLVKGELRPWSKEARMLLLSRGIPLRIVDKIHCKMVIVDNNLLANGSFNWLSATRSELSPFANYEVTTVSCGEDLSQQIEQVLAPLVSHNWKENAELRGFYDHALEARKGNLQQAKGLVAIFSQHPVFGPWARDILLNQIKGSADKGADICNFMASHGGVNCTEQIMVALSHEPQSLDEFMDFMESFYKIDFEKTNAVLSRMSDYVDYGENIDEYAQRLREKGFDKIANSLEYEAYHSPDASWALKNS